MQNPLRAYTGASTQQKNSNGASPKPLLLCALRCQDITNVSKAFSALRRLKRLIPHLHPAQQKRLLVHNIALCYCFFQHSGDTVFVDSPQG